MIFFKMRNIGIISLVVLSCLFTGQEIVFADGDACSLDAAGWNPDSAGPIVTWTAPVCKPGDFVVQPFFFYNRTRGIFNEEGRYKSFKNKDTKSQYQEALLLKYGFIDRLEIASYGVYQQNLIKINGNSASATGFGDTYMYVRYCLMEDKGWMPHVTAIFQLKMPTGKYQKLDEDKLGTDNMGATTGGGSYDHGYGVNLTKKLKPFILHVDFAYNFPIMTRVDGVKTSYGDYVNYDFGVEYFLPKGFNVIFECNGLIQGDLRADGELVPASDINSLTLSPGIGWSCKEIQFLIAYQRTVSGSNVDVNDSVVATFVYTF